MDTRIIRRLAYDGNYQRAIEILLDTVEEQEKRIQDLESISQMHLERIEELEKSEELNSLDVEITED